MQVVAMVRKLKLYCLVLRFWMCFITPQSFVEMPTKILLFQIMKAFWVWSTWMSFVRRD